MCDCETQLFADKIFAEHKNLVGQSSFTCADDRLNYFSRNYGRAFNFNDIGGGPTRKERNIIFFSCRFRNLPFFLCHPDVTKQVVLRVSFCFCWLFYNFDVGVFNLLLLLYQDIICIPFTFFSRCMDGNKPLNLIG